ncbi:MAG TPA: type VI secretion system tip protein TssI/VgrG [bacterium]|nr:type VI secretion system tip protein TssI/VgrG [bacterium]
MPVFKYNEPYYTLQFSEVDEGVLRVLSFEGDEELSRNYEYRFELLSEEPDIDSGKILNKKATLVVSLGEDEPLKVHGIISQFEQRGRTPDYVSYHAVLVPRFWWTTLNYQSQIFQEMDVEEIVTKVLKDSGFASGDFEFQLNESYPVREFVVQYRESDFNFINRWLEHYGIFYYFDQSNDTDKIIFADANDAFPMIDGPEEVFYNPNKDPLSEKETIGEFVYRGRIVTGSSRLKDYNYLFPNKQMMVESSLNGAYPGNFYDYGDHFHDEKAGGLLVKVRNEEQICPSKLFHGLSDCRFFRPGYRFQMSEHYRQDWNAEFILTRVSYEGTQRGLFSRLGPDRMNKPTYQNVFEAIPSDAVYRPPRVSSKPKIDGIMNAKVDASGNGQYAEVDDQGRYKVILPFDLSGKQNGEASKYIRLAQPYSGPDYGIHFPLHKDAEILLAFIDGDPDRPIIVGAPPNPANASPVTNANQPQNVIRTAAANEMVMDDTIDKAKISIKTPDANQITLDDENDNIEVLTTNKHKIVLDDKNKNITIQSKNGHLFVFDDGNKKISMQSKKGHMLNLNDEDGSESMTFTDSDGENRLIIDISNSKMVIESKKGDIDMHAPKGTIDIKADTFNLETTGDTIMKSDANITADAGADYTQTAGGNMTQEATGDLSQKGTNVTSEASMDHKSSGMNITAEASMEYKNKGMNVTSEAGVNMQVKGTMITIQSSGPHTIKGTPVMIN